MCMTSIPTRDRAAVGQWRTQIESSDERTQKSTPCAYQDLASKDWLDATGEFDRRYSLGDRIGDALVKYGAILMVIYIVGGYAWEVWSALP